jgi:hypothetical protein
MVDFEPCIVLGLRRITRKQEKGKQEKCLLGGSWVQDSSGAS